jgi:hypothetical protein
MYQEELLDEKAEDFEIMIQACAQLSEQTDSIMMGQLQTQLLVGRVLEGIFLRHADSSYKHPNFIKACKALKLEVRTAREKHLPVYRMLRV